MTGLVSPPAPSFPTRRHPRATIEARGYRGADSRRLGAERLGDVVRELVGYVPLRSGGFAAGIYVLSVPEGVYRIVAPDLTHQETPELAWLQDSRRLLFSESEAGIQLVDTETGHVRQLLRPPAGSFYRRAQLGSGDREIFFLREEQEADLWMASFTPLSR